MSARGEPRLEQDDVWPEPLGLEDRFVYVLSVAHDLDGVAVEVFQNSVCEVLAAG